VLGVAPGLSLTKVFDSSEHVLSDGSLIFNDLFNNNGFGETLFNTLGLHGFGSAIQKFLLSVTEGMELGVVLAGVLLDARV